MKLLDKLILKDLVPILLMGIALFSLFLTFAGPMIAAARFISQGVPLWVVAQFVGWNSTFFIQYTFPMGMLVAALLGFDRLSRDSEAVALFAGGIPFRRMIVPVLALGLIVSVIGYGFNDRIASYAKQRVAEIIEHRQDVMGETTRAFHFENRQGGNLQLTVQVEKGYDIQAKALRDVTVVAFDTQGNPIAVSHAEKARWHGGTAFELLNGTVYDLKTGSSLHAQTLGTYDLQKTPENLVFLQRDPETLDFHDLQKQIAQLRATGASREEVLNAETSLWNKIAIPFACLVFGLIGAPLGMRAQRGASKFGGRAWAILTIPAYYVLYMIMSSLAQGGYCPPALAAWLPNIIGMVAGAGLIWRTSS